ncbi:MAG TPA: SDR family NAD(P)-dependent oxidoreductase [Ktedonobacteraceae bacterium]|nr:SDR family NAD(P)-dependent oxidoreductase [Ktedonobacteraceae bacterium]
MTNHSHDLPQTVILTGGTSGVGYAGAQTIAASHPDWHVLLASRNQRQGTQAVNTLQHETGLPVPQTGFQHIEWMSLDLASLASVRAFAREVAVRDLPPLHAVICNAGLQVVSGTTYTQDGFETTFGVNCLGHFLLVNLLLRQLVAPARIVFVSSDLHDPESSKTFMSRMIGTMPPRYRDARALAWSEQYPDPEERNESPKVVGMRRYSTSKLCDIFYAYELARRLQSQGHNTPEHPITVNAFNPGPTPGTHLSRDAGAFGDFAWNVLFPHLRFAMPHMQSLDASGKALARLVLDPTLEGLSGKYFDGMEERASSQESYDQQKARELWEASAELVKLQPTETILRVGARLEEQFQ